MTDQFTKQAEEAIRATGDRVTPGRIAVLASLLAQPQAITHQTLEAQLKTRGRIDRVTLYRVLGWLSEKALVHKVISGDRVARYRVSDAASLHQHAHFQCNRCTTVVCLDAVDTGAMPALPRGYRSQTVELTVKGVCAQCS